MSRRLWSLSLLLLVLILAPRAHAAWPPDGVPIADLASSQNGNATISDGSGGAYVAWADLGSRPARVMVHRIDRSGEPAPGWPPNGQRATDLALPALLPALLEDGRDGVFVTWFSESDSSLYAQHFSGNGRRARGWPEHGVRLGPLKYSANPAALVSDGRGGAIVAWDALASFNFPLPGRVLAQRIDGAGRRLWGMNGIAIDATSAYREAPVLWGDGHVAAVLAWTHSELDGSPARMLRLSESGAPARGWPGAGLAVTSPVPGAQRVAKLIDDEAGGVLAVFGDSRASSVTSSNSDLYAQRILLGGVRAPGWDAAGVPVCTAPRGQGSLTACGDGRGGFIAAWVDQRPGIAGVLIFGQRMDRETHALWGSDGRALSPGRGPQRRPVLSPDGRGGAILAYEMWPGGQIQEGDVYAQHVLGNGEPAPGWDPSGEPVTTAPRLQYNIAMTEDSRGRPILTWLDGRNFDSPSSGYQVFASRIDVRVRGRGRGLEDEPAVVAAPAVASPLARPRVLANASRHPQLAFSLPAAGEARLEVFDIGGRRVASSELGAVAGELRIDVPGLETRPAGVYLVRVSQGERAWVSRVLLVK